MSNTFVKIDKETKLFQVIEDKSEQILKTFEDHTSAKKFSKQQNSGVGFNGFTPAFVLKSVKEFIP